MAKHAAPVVVRLWRHGYHNPSIAALVHDWDGAGGFTLPADHPAAKAMWAECGRSALQLTVFESEELEWHLDSISNGIGENRDRYVIHCSPRRDQLRRVLAVDGVLIEHGLVS